MAGRTEDRGQSRAEACGFRLSLVPSGPPVPAQGSSLPPPGAGGGSQEAPAKSHRNSGGPDLLWVGRELRDWAAALLLPGQGGAQDHTGGCAQSHSQAGRLNLTFKPFIQPHPAAPSPSPRRRQD